MIKLSNDIIKQIVLFEYSNQLNMFERNVDYYRVYGRNEVYETILQNFKEISGHKWDDTMLKLYLETCYNTKEWVNISYSFKRKDGMICNCSINFSKEYLIELLNSDSELIKFNNLNNNDLFNISKSNNMLKHLQEIDDIVYSISNFGKRELISIDNIFIQTRY